MRTYTWKKKRTKSWTHCIFILGNLKNLSLIRKFKVAIRKMNSKSCFAVCLAENRLRWKNQFQVSISVFIVMVRGERNVIAWWVWNVYMRSPRAHWAVSRQDLQSYGIAIGAGSQENTQNVVETKKIHSSLHWFANWKVFPVWSHIASLMFWCVTWSWHKRSNVVIGTNKSTTTLVAPWLAGIKQCKSFMVILFCKCQWMFLLMLHCFVLGRLWKASFRTLEFTRVCFEKVGSEGSEQPMFPWVWRGNEVSAWNDAPPSKIGFASAWVMSIHLGGVLPKKTLQCSINWLVGNWAPSQVLFVHDVISCRLQNTLKHQNSDLVRIPEFTLQNDGHESHKGSYSKGFEDLFIFGGLHWGMRLNKVRRAYIFSAKKDQQLKPVFFCVCLDVPRS